MFSILIRTWLNPNFSISVNHMKHNNPDFDRTLYRNFGVLCLLETPVLRFALLPYYRRYIIIILIVNML